MTRLSLAKSFGGIGSSVGILSAAFSTVGGEESHDILVMDENLVKNFCGFCCNSWCWIFRGDTFSIFS